MFADELIALHDVCPAADITYIANLEGRGLPKTRLDAEIIRGEMTARGVEPELTGALDEYGANGDLLGKRRANHNHRRLGWTAQFLGARLYL